MREQIAQQPPTQKQRSVTYQPESEDLEDRIFSTRSNTSTRRYQPQQPTRTHLRIRHQTAPPEHVQSTHNGTKLIAPPESAPRAPHTGFFLVVCGVLLAIVVGVLLVHLIGAWWQTSQDDAHYGRPRTFQCDALVGHGDDPQHLSHFIALNLNRQVQVIELPAGDATKAKVYLGPLLAPGQELAPVTLEFRDINDDGKPDMLITVENIRIAFMNENGSFRPLHEGEHVNA